MCAEEWGQCRDSFPQRLLLHCHFVHVHVKTYESMFTQDSDLFLAAVYKHRWCLSNIIKTHISLYVCQAQNHSEQVMWKCLKSKQDTVKLRDELPSEVRDAGQRDAHQINVTVICWHQTWRGGNVSLPGCCSYNFSLFVFEKIISLPPHIEKRIVNCIMCHLGFTIRKQEDTCTKIPVWDHGTYKLNSKADFM